MPETLCLPDLDTLDPAALRPLLLAHHERYTARLSSSATEIERLVLLVEQLQRMLFGARSNKVLRQIEQLELQLLQREFHAVMSQVEGWSVGALRGRIDSKLSKRTASPAPRTAKGRSVRRFSDLYSGTLPEVIRRSVCKPARQE